MGMVPLHGSSRGSDNFRRPEKVERVSYVEQSDHDVEPPVCGLPLHICAPKIVEPPAVAAHTGQQKGQGE
eukprot:scaffold51762_cov37-Tisochrysis_lutea.AAC.1